jgi:uncharacterized protein (DUF4415 family)
MIFSWRQVQKRNRLWIFLLFQEIWNDLPEGKHQNPVSARGAFARSKSKGGRLKSENLKVLMGNPLSPEAFRATGKGWQTRMNAALAGGLKTHSPMDVG